MICADGSVRLGLKKLQTETGNGAGLLDRASQLRTTPLHPLGPGRACPAALLASALEGPDALLALGPSASPLLQGAGLLYSLFAGRGEPFLNCISTKPPTPIVHFAGKWQSPRIVVQPLRTESHDL